MSKSLGNTIDPIDVIEKYGADILRLWVASVDFKADLKCSDELFKIASEQYRKVRNTFRFLLGNINNEDFNYAKDAIAYQDLTSLDKYILIKLNEVIDTVINAYDRYDYILASNTLFTFMSNTISAFYMDYAKDILYIEKKENLRRRQIQTVFYQVADALNRLWAPILSYTMEEVYEIFSQKEKSVILEGFPTSVKHEDDKEICTQWEKYMDVRSDILKALEEAKISGLIKKALETKIYYCPKDEYKDALKGLTNHDLAQLVIASQFEVTAEKYEEYPTGYIKVEKFNGHVCPRCWNVVTDIDKDGLCLRCQNVLK
jgi:isoleucyl-tRNA synthetase